MYPAGTGFLVGPGSKGAPQVHFNSHAAAEGERADQTRVEPASTGQRKAFILPRASPDGRARAQRGLDPGVDRDGRQGMPLTSPGTDCGW